MEVLASRRSTLVAREADLQRRIRELGSLPSEAFEKYKGKGKKVGFECAGESRARSKVGSTTVPWGAGSGYR